ncbi:uncharacterized protein LOC110828159 isoform X2 [Zootermopsis nevadensis]|uniref:uncharacterized protein LOC110828159 isoform X2 n=1 Tax=Zootermopsis nevadensis TaxID=136037 RepID=UPI000B8E2A9C|nr:uncharacterized protein LOC110828159 isoform X2 [Zootermopsis nevadensis]
MPKMLVKRSFKKMKRTKNQNKVGPEEARMDSELSEKTDCDDTTASSSLPQENVCYHLRNRPIFYFNNCGKHDESIYISHEENVSSIRGTGYTESKNFKGWPQINVNTFSQELQTLSKNTGRFISEPTIMRLPNEMLTMIFSYFDVRELSTAVAPVCKHWYTVAHSSVLWRKLCFNGDGISTEKAKCLLTKSPLLSELIISCRDDVDELLCQLCRTNQHVQSVAIKRCTNSEVVNSWDWPLLRARYLNRLIKCCPKIRTLKLNELCIRSDKFFHDLGLLLPNLTCLHLSLNHFLKPKHIKNIATKCCSLARLWLSGECCCGRKEEWENAYQTLFRQRWKTLTHLQFDASKLTDDVFKDLSLCVNLRSLHIHKATYLFCVGLTAVGTLPNLISLRLHKANHLCSTTLLSLFQNRNLGILVYLSLAGCTCINDDCAAIIALHCSQIHLLSLALIEGITDKGIETIVKHCSSLHYLDIYCMKNVTGTSFSYISQYAHDLNFLVVENVCNNEKEANLKALSALNSNLKVHRRNMWKTGGIYGCRLLQ